MTASLEKLLGPRIAPDVLKQLLKFVLPSLALGMAGVMLVISIFLPYWKMTLLAPQYPGGLTMQAYLNHLEGDVHEIDELNHYIGMRPLGEAASLERSLSLIAVLAIALLVLAAIYIHNHRAALLALPALAFPAAFLVDLHFWMRSFGTHLDPHAPLSSSIKPFVPPVIGRGTVGQFATLAMPGPGLWLALVASLLILVGLWLHRRAYKPLVDAKLG